MEKETKIQLLRDEYFYLQKVIEDFDSKSITIKAWSVTGSLAGIALGLKEGNPYVVLISAFAAAFFWLVEAYWKVFQLSYYGRVRKIEAYFQNPDNAEIEPLQLTNSWSKHWNIRKKQLFRIMLWPHVYLPHVIIFLGGLVVFVLKVK